MDMAKAGGLPGRAGSGADATDNEMYEPVGSPASREADKNLLRHDLAAGSVKSRRRAAKSLVTVAASEW
jgi:hypothetical protein